MQPSLFPLHTGNVRAAKLTIGRPRDAFLARVNIPHPHRCHCTDSVSTMVCGQLFSHGIDGSKVCGTIRSKQDNDLDERLGFFFVQSHLAK